MEEYLLLTWARASKGHEDEKQFLKILEEFVSDCEFEHPEGLADDVEPYFDQWSSTQWRDAIASGNHLLTTDHCDLFEDWANDNITEWAETVASVGYDLYGPAHSGYNAVYRFLGVYFLRGSDYIEGPSTEPGELIKYLRFCDDDGFDCYIDPDYESHKSVW